jgi:two-component system sensor histidine kinase ChvG
VPVANLAAELLANRNLLSALAGPSIGLTMDTDGGALPARITGEDLTRVLVNLVKNAAEAMPAGGRIHMTLRERPVDESAARCMLLTVEDNGPGVPQQALEAIFDSGYTTRDKDEPQSGGWPLRHRGLGLAITRSIVEAAGGRIGARNREAGGACFEIELPVRKAAGC